MRPWNKDLSQTSSALSNKEISAVELVTALFDRIEKYDPALSAFIWTDREYALSQATEVDRRRAHGEALSPLSGIPICVKDLFDIQDIPSTYGGMHFRSHVPNHTATSAKRLLDAGAILLGKTNLHEYAYGTTSENPHYGNVHNPWNRGKISGGSSGGTSVAITAGLALAGLGTDTGGSIRIPASLTGHVGLKPTYGLVSKHGVFPLAPSLDHVGPMAKTVQDVALLLNYMAGYDPLDEGSIRVGVRDYVPSPTEVEAPLSGIRVGIPRMFFFDRCHANVLQVISATLHQLEGAGAHIIEVDIEESHDVPVHQNAIISSEAIDVHRPLMEDMSLYGDDVRRRLVAGQEITGADLVAAYRFRQSFRHQVSTLFANRIDVLMTPTTPLTGTDIGQYKAHIKAHEVNVRAHLTRYTNPWNITGLPALSLPCGLAADGLPVGLQLVGSAFSEKKLLRIAAQVESLLNWNAVAPDYR